MRLNHKLNELGDERKYRILDKALNEAIDPIIAQGRANLAARNKVRKGNLITSFKKKYKKRTSSIYAGFTKKGNSAHLVDRGTKERWTSKGYYRGSVSKGQPKKGSMFWTDAVRAKGTEALNRLSTTITRYVNYIWSKI